MFHLGSINFLAAFFHKDYRDFKFFKSWNQEARFLLDSITLSKNLQGRREKGEKMKLRRHFVSYSMQI